MVVLHLDDSTAEVREPKVSSLLVIRELMQILGLLAGSAAILGWMYVLER
jgi:hypothetical protein